MTPSGKLGLIDYGACSRPSQPSAAFDHSAYHSKLCSQAEQGAAHEHRQAPCGLPLRVLEFSCCGPTLAVLSVRKAIADENDDAVRHSMLSLDEDFGPALGPAASLTA